MEKFQLWIDKSGYEITNRGHFRKGNVEFTADELAEIFLNEF